MATAKKAKPATKGKASGKATKVSKAAKVVKKTPPKPAAKSKIAVKTAKAAKVAAKAKPKVATKAKASKVAPKSAKAGKVTKVTKATKVPAKKPVAVKSAKNTKAKPLPKAVAKSTPPKPTKAPPKVTSKNAPPKLAAKTAAKAAPAAKSDPKASSKAPAPAAKMTTPAVPAKSSKAPVSVPAALEKPKTPVGKQSLRPTLVAAVPTVTVTAPTRALPKSLTVKAAVSNVLPFNPKTTGVAGYLSEAEILKQPKDKYMSKEQLAFFKQRLMELQSQLRENAGQTTEHLRELAIVPDPADRATLEEEHALELRARDRERKLLKKVEAAILRIDEGDYGYCEETGEPIGIPRLLARPTATLSIEAQERRELKQRMFGE